MNKIIHIVGAGGTAGIGMTRCLNKTKGLKITGHDTSEYAENMAECEISEPWEADMVIPVPDAAVNSKYGDSAVSFCPDQKQVILCQNKARTAKVLGYLAPKTYWVRDVEGAGGAGAKMASEFLPGANFSVEFVFFNGKRLARFQKERISYLLKRKEMDVTHSGSSAVSVCRSDKHVNKVAEHALRKIAEHTKTPLHGFYGVDMKENENNEIKVTEINAGRLLTASYNYYSMTGYNLPLVGVCAFLGLPEPKLPPYPEGYGVLRQTDCIAKLVDPEVTRKWE